VQGTCSHRGGAGPRAAFDQIATRKRGAVRARNAAQNTYIKALKQNELVFAEGPAGTGKTWLAVGYAVSLLEAGQVDRLIISRPPWRRASASASCPATCARRSTRTCARSTTPSTISWTRATWTGGLQTGMIEIAPLAFMRGRTLTNALVLLDEAQNTTTMQMKMFLTRLGEGSRMIITGDPTQIDLPPGRNPGSIEAVRILDGVEGIGRVDLQGAGRGAPRPRAPHRHGLRGGRAGRGPHGRGGAPPPLAARRPPRVSAPALHPGAAGRERVA
jgi:phosphate starvation-inducible PhoH-like protein